MVVSALAKSTWIVSYVFGLIHINWCRISSINSIQFTVPNCKMTVFKDIGLEVLAIFMCIATGHRIYHVHLQSQVFTPYPSFSHGTGHST